MKDSDFLCYYCINEDQSNRIYELIHVGSSQMYTCNAYIHKECLCLWLNSIGYAQTDSMACSSA